MQFKFFISELKKMNKIPLILVLLIYSSNSNVIETFSQKFENYFEIRYDQVSGSSFYDSNGELKISNIKDSTLFDDSDDPVPVQVQSIFNRNYSDLTLNYKYFILEDLNINGSIAYRNDVLSSEDLWTFLDTIGQPVDTTRIYPEKSQNLFGPFNINAEYFFSKKKFISSINAGTTIPIGNFDPFADSTLNGNGLGNINLGVNLGYESKTAYFQISAAYVNYFSTIENQLHLRASLDVYSVENVDLFAKLDYHHNLTEIQANSFNPDIPNESFNRLLFRAGAALSYNDFKFKVLFAPTVLGSNVIDFRGWGLAVAYSLSTKEKNK